MIHLPPHLRVFVHLEPVDFRNGIDGLAGLCRSRLRQDPMSGAVFLFINRPRTSLKILVYDGQGLWLCHKRLSQGKIRFWPKTTTVLTGPQAQTLIYDGNPQGSEFSAPWKPVGPKG